MVQQEVVVRQGGRRVQLPPVCRACGQPMWWDVSYPYEHCWYCSTCCYPSEADRAPDPRTAGEEGKAVVRPG